MGRTTSAPGHRPASFYGARETAEARSLADVPWWEVFRDPVLEQLVDEALRNGFDARLAAARVEEARALYGIAKGGLLPGRPQGGYEHRP